MAKLSKILEKLLTTEKTTKAKDSFNRYIFRVRNGASQGTIRVEVEKLYKVDVENVNLMIVPGKKRRLARTSRYIRLPRWKKAVVQIKEGQKIAETKAGKLTEEKNDKKL